jgi:thymidine kinase
MSQTDTTVDHVGGRVKLIIGPMYARKCLGRDTPVIMHDGSVRMVQDITEGEFVMGDDSSAREVTGVVSGRAPMYKVSPVNGNPFVCTDNHILSLKFTGHNVIYHDSARMRYRAAWYRLHNGTPELVARSFPYLSAASKETARLSAECCRAVARLSPNYIPEGATMDISVTEYAGMPACSRDLWMCYRVPVEYTQTQQQMDPYVFGAWICSHDGLFLTRSAVVLSRIKQRCKQINHTLCHVNNNGVVTCFVHGPTGIIRRADTAGIPHEYICGSRDQRLALLAGILDNSSEVTGDINRYIHAFSHPDAKLVGDVARVAWSLGLEAVCTTTDSTHTVTIFGHNADLIPSIVQPRPCEARDHLMSAFSVAPLGEGDYFGFSLDGNGRFLLGDHTVTHNTGSMSTQVEKYHIAQKKCAIVRYAGDTRYEPTHGGLVDHAGREYHHVPVIVASALGDVFDELVACDVIGIDEVQFYDDNVEVIQRLANMGKIVVAAGLDGTAKGTPFKRMPELIAVAESVKKKSAVCMSCHAKAGFTRKIGGNDEEVEIGGIGTYIAVCRDCMWNLSHDEVVSRVKQWG